MLMLKVPNTPLLSNERYRTWTWRHELQRGSPFDSRVQTHDHDPMSYERPYNVKFLFISNFTHAILPIIFAVHT